MPKNELLITINNNILKILEKIDTIEKRLNNIEINGTSNNINWISYLNDNYPDEDNLKVMNFSNIDVNQADMLSLYNNNIDMKDFISLKINRYIHTFEGIKSFSKNKNTFIKLNNEWKIIDIADIISIITWIKIACFKCTKTFPFKTQEEREVVDKVDKTISKDITDILINITKQTIYNAVKADL